MSISMKCREKSKREIITSLGEQRKFKPNYLQKGVMDEPVYSIEF